MFKYIKFLLVTVSFCFIFSCTPEKTKPLIIEFSADSSKIVLKNINDAGLFQLQNNLNTDSAYQQLVQVLETPADNDSTSMEVEWQGKLSLAEDILLFTPSVPFVKGKTYLVETILNAKFATGEDIIKDKVGTQIKPQQKILKR